MPLGVVANQLMKVEEDLRFLNVKASVYPGEHLRGDLTAQAVGRLEKINETLELIRGLVLDLETEFQSASARPPKNRVDRDD